MKPTTRASAPGLPVQRGPVLMDRAAEAAAPRPLAREGGFPPAPPPRPRGAPWASARRLDRKRNEIERSAG